MTYSESLEYIHSVSWRGCRPGLERIVELCRKMGDPQDSLRFVHIAGTNGKGSTSSMLSSILLSAGYTVGLFTSPYVESFNERIRYNGVNIADDELAEVTEYVRGFADTMADQPTEFELITAIGLEYFARKKCDIVVLECGLGGRLDSTNVISTPVLSVITGIDLDHMSLLGDTTEKMAWEKAGIIKPSVPVLYGECDEAAARVIEKAAAEACSTCRHTDFSRISMISSDLDGSVFRFGGEAYSLFMLGLYQLQNAATVLTAVEMLREQGIALSPDAVREGLASARWSARFEILSRSPFMVYDGAHNPQGISAAVENIKHYLAPLSPDGKLALLMGVMSDKDHGKMIEMLSPLVWRAFTVSPQNERSLDASAVADEFSLLDVPSASFPTVYEGVAAAVRAARESGRPLICLGSLYMYADVKAAARDIVND